MELSLISLDPRSVCFEPEAQSQWYFSDNMTLLRILSLPGDDMPWSMAAPCVFVFVLASLYLIYKRLLPRPLPGIPYNAGANKSLWGDQPALARYLSTDGEFSTWLGEQCMQMGSPVCQVFVQPFKMPWILVADFHEAQDILMRRPEFDKPQFLTDALQCLGDFHARYKNGDAFKARRQLRQDLMAPNHLNNYIGPFLYSRALDLLYLFEIKTDLAKGRPFSVREDYTRTVLDVMLHHTFGKDYNEPALEPQMELLRHMTPSMVPESGVDEPVNFAEAPRSLFIELLHETAQVLEKTTASPSPQISFWWWSKQTWYKKIVREKNQVLEEQLRKGARNLEAGTVRSALDHILMRERIAAEKQGREPQLYTQSLADEIFADPMTGQHTTSSALAWVTKYLTGYSHAQSKLREELYSTMTEAVEEKRLPRFEEIRRARLPYLEAVMEEARRLTPFVVVRETTKDTEILGHKIPKGVQCLMVSAGPGITMPSVPVNERTRSETSKKAKPWGKWDESRDLKLFEPERWLKLREDGKVDFDATSGPQLGFGMGTRQCWGRRLAQLMVRTIIPLVVWEFELLEIPEKLGGYTGIDGISREPVNAFARLRKLDLSELRLS